MYIYIYFFSEFRTTSMGSKGMDRRKWKLEIFEKHSLPLPIPRRKGRNSLVSKSAQILDRDRNGRRRRVLQTSGKKWSFAFSFIVGKENRNSLWRRERERDEDGKKTLEESGRVERKEGEEEEGDCQTSVGRFLDLAPTFSLRCFAWPSALKG